MMAKSDALQRQLDNDEPKCGNCKEWQRVLQTAFGWCNNPKNNVVAPCPVEMPALN